MPGSGSWVALCRLKDQTLSSQTCTALCLHWNWLTGRDPGAGKDWRGEGDDRGWDGLMASPTRWTWVWESSRSWWWTGGLACCSPQSREESDMTERLNWTVLIFSCSRQSSSGLSLITHFYPCPTVQFRISNCPESPSSWVVLRGLEPRILITIHWLFFCIFHHSPYS